MAKSCLWIFALTCQIVVSLKSELTKINAGNCGQSLTKRRHREPRIIGGVPAMSGEFPWQAALVQVYPPSGEILSYPCGATIIHQRWAITSSHCLIE